MRLTNVIVLSVLLLFGFACKQGGSETVNPAVFEKKAVLADNAIVKDRKVEVLYFHTNARCYSCKKIEEYTKKALQLYFDNQLKSGRLIFKSVNIEEDNNRHYVQDYKLFSKSVVLVDKLNGKQVKWKKLAKIWRYIRKQHKFLMYTKKEIVAFVGGGR